MSDFLDEVLIFVADLTDHVPPRPGGIVATEDLRAYASKNRLTRIDVTQSEEMDERLLKGMYIRHEDRVEIIIPTTLNYCWQRYIVVKELMHLIRDVPRDFTQTPSALIEELFFRQFSGQKAADAEFTAMLAAMAYMLPTSHRPPTLTTQCNSRLVAEAFRIPEIMVTYFYRHVAPRASKLMLVAG